MGVGIALAACFTTTASLNAQVSVGPGGSGVITFSTIADTNGWTGANRLPNSGTAVTTGADLDSAVQTNTAPSIVATATTSPVGSAVTADAGATPATSGTPRWNSTVQALATRPTGDSYNLLMGQFRNDSGGCVNEITISFEMNSYNAASAELPGWHVFYSMSGEAGSWQKIDAFSDVVVTGILSTNISLAGSLWNPGTSLYLLFADDNGNGVSDPSYTIDNFSLNITPCLITCVGITNQSSNITVPERGAATFSIMATGSPQNIQWYRNGTAIPGAVSSTYTIPSVVYPGDNGAQFSATVSNVLCNASSTIKTLTVTPDTTPPTVTRAVADIDPTKVLLTFSEPMDAATINETSFILFERGTDPFASSYITFGATLTTPSNVVVTTDSRLAGVNYSILMLDLRDASSGNNQINPNPSQVPLLTTLELIGFDVNNEWKYDINNGDRTGTGWEQVGFDDSTWPSGPAGLGLDTSANGVPILTTLGYTANGVVTYFRRHFILPATTNGVTLTLRDVVEDGAVYYLNGQEVFRNRMPAGAVTFATLANGAAEPQPISGPFNLAITNLHAGDNVLAVEVHQSSATSTDIEMAAELRAVVTEFLGGPAKITTPPQSFTVNEGQSATFTVLAEGELPLSYQWRKAGVDLPGQTNASLTFNPALPSDAGNYTVFVSNSLGSTNSPVATLTVNADLTAPVIVSAIGSTNLSTVVVTLRDPVPGRGIDLATASDPTHYQVRLTAGGGILTVISAVATNIGTNTIVTLTTSTPRTQGQDYTVVLNNVTDASAAHNAVSPNTAGIQATVLLFAFDNTWRYDQSGTDLGTAWKEIVYNDGAWPSGRGVLGFETSSNTLVFLRSIAPPDGTNTILSLTNDTLAGIGGTNITFYFRTTVNVPLNPAGATMRMSAYIDDGAIIYVNGIEQLRFNQTNGPGYTNLANAALAEPNPAPQTTFIVSNLGGFVSGANVIAVEVHQDSRASSDVDFGMQLEALVTSFTGPITGPRLNISRNPTTGQVTISWSGGGILQQASAIPVGGPASWTDVPGNPNPYVFTPTPGQNRFFSLRQ